MRRKGVREKGCQGPFSVLCSDAPSAPCTRKDARSTTTTYTYDTLNRLTSKSYNGKNGVRYHFCRPTAVR
jgi:YD repeat-containing protein